MQTTFLITCAAGWEREARRELEALLPGARVQRLFLKGALLLVVPLSRRDALDHLAQAETEFVGRVVPIAGGLTVGRTSEAVAPLAQDCARVVQMSPGECFVVRARRRGEHRFTSTQLKQAVARALEEVTGATGDYLAEHPDWVVQLEVLQDRVFVGLGRPEEFLQKQVRRRRRYEPGERPLNRAQHKLREAVEEFHIPVSAAWRVLDLGSAPGGWAAYLAPHVGEVVAVDPAALATEVLALANIAHHRMRLEEFLGHYSGSAFDFLTNDMNIDPELSAALMVQTARLLRAGGWALMTVKYTSRRRRQHREAAARILAQEYRDLHFRRLPHNRREVTVVMRRAEGGFSS